MRGQSWGCAWKKPGNGRSRRRQRGPNKGNWGCVREGRVGSGGCDVAQTLTRGVGEIGTPAIGILSAGTLQNWP